ncbi:MAG: hypothetical protein JW749_03930 [Sedimentisphaerales bacterium]|nr:hypothetical protein [Sedimentisphaerales bacterium]
MKEKRFQKLLSAHVDAELCERFLRQAYTRCIVKKRALAGAVKLWTKLPGEIQARLVDQSLDESSFTELVGQIIDKRIGQKEPTKAGHAPRQQLREAISRIREMVEIESRQPGTIYRVLDSDEQKVLDEFRKLVSTEEQKKSKTA